WWITIFDFRWMFLAYRNKAILFEKDKIHSKKEVIRGRLVGVGGRRQGFSFKFDNGEEVPVDFSYLITGGYRIINSAILTNAEVEITRLPHSLLCYGVRYIHLPEQKQIGRASCRERVKITGQAADLDKKHRDRVRQQHCELDQRTTHDEKRV